MDMIFFSLNKIDLLHLRDCQTFFSISIKIVN